MRTWSLRVDLEAARRGYRRYAVYPAAVVAGVFTNVVFAFLLVAILLTVLDQQDSIGGYTQADIETYVWLGQALMMTVMIYTVWDDIALRVRSGDIATDLVRPLDVQRYWLAYDLGRATHSVLFRGVPPFVIGSLIYDLHLPGSIGAWACSLASVALAVTVSFGYRFLYNCAAFWTGDIRGIGVLCLVVATVASGFLVPLPFYPDAVEQILRWLPFASMIQTPVDVFLGKLTGLALAGALLGQLAWAVIMLGAGRLVFATAVRRVVIQGG